MSTDTNFKPSVQTFALTAGGTAEVMAEANPMRTSIIIQPITENSYVNFGATAGTQATGTLTAGDVPDINETIAVNGVTFTYVASSASATQITRGANVAETADNTATILNASANAAISIATYTSDGVDTVTITYDAGGVDGNAYALADSSAASVTASGLFLTGGANTGGGLLLAAGSQYIYSCSEYPQVCEDIYILSATNAAVTQYLEAIQAA